jgi:hypothetical protein
VERSKYEFSKSVPKGDAANGQSQQSQQVHSIYGDIDRASPQSTLDCPTSGALHTLQQKETRKHLRNQDYIYSRYKFSDNKVSVVLFFRVSANAFAPSAPIQFPTDTSEWRDPNTNSAKQLQRATIRQSQQSQRAHLIHGGIDRGSPQSTFNSPTSGALHTLRQKKPGNPNHQRNQDCSPLKSSDNEVSVVFSFRASANAFVPSAPIPLTTDTPEWWDSNTNSAKQFQ